MATFADLMNGFGVVTVFDACIYQLDGSYTGSSDCCSIGSSAGAFTPSRWIKTGLGLDTLKIANITQEGPTKEIKGGKYANTLIKYGKTARIEMQDALGRAETMVKFFGCDYDEENGILSITDKFPGPFAIEGKTFFIDQETGDKVDVYIFIPQVAPDALLTLNQDAEGDATVFDLNGSLNITKVADKEGAASRDIFYEIRKKSFFLEGDEVAQDVTIGNGTYTAPYNVTVASGATTATIIATRADASGKTISNIQLLGDAYGKTAEGSAASTGITITVEGLTAGQTYVGTVTYTVAD